MTPATGSSPPTAAPIAGVRPAWHAPQAPLVLALLALLALTLAAGAAAIAGPTLQPQWAALIVAAVLAPAAALWLAARAGLHGGAALAVIAGAMVLLSDANLPGRGGTGLDAQSAIKFGLWTLGLLLLLWRGPALRAALAQPASGLLALFALWCLAGSIYSATPTYTFAAALALAGIWVTATAFAQAVTLRTGLLVICGALLAAMAITLAMYVLAPALALTPLENGRVLRLSGLFGSPNNLGRAAALAILLALLLVPLLPRGRALALVALALLLGGACLELADSRGSTAALVAGLAAAWFGRRRGLALALAVLVASAVLLVVAVPALQEAIVAELSRSGRVSEVMTLTGRTMIWSATLELVERSPWIGHGFATTRELLPEVYRTGFGWTTTSAHNLWLQALATTGVIGLLIVLAAQLAWLKQAITQPQPVRDAVVVFVLVLGVLEASALGPSVNLLTFVLCWAVALCTSAPERA